MDAFNPDRAEVEELKARYRAGTVGDVEVKRRLAVVLNEYLAPLRQRREQYASRPDDIIDILHAGTARAHELANQTLAEVQEKMGLATNLIKPNIPVSGQKASIGEYQPKNLLYVP